LTNLNGNKFAGKRVWKGGADCNQSNRVQRIFEIDETPQMGGDVTDGGCHNSDASNGDEEAEIAATET
jgi:hypothetical protein